MPSSVEVECSACAGKNAACVVCEGTGLVTKNACRRCAGRGTEGASEKACFDCRGRGYRDVDTSTTDNTVTW